MMKFFQKLGKSLMLPVACLPVCGILMGIGYILASAAMAGEVQGFTAGGLSLLNRTVPDQSRGCVDR